VAGAFTANAQTLVGSLGAMSIAGTLQSMNSTAAINGLNAANGVSSINAQQNAAVNQALNGTPPQGSNAGNVTASVTVNGVTQALDPITGLPVSAPGEVTPGGLPGMGGMGGGVTPPPPGNHHPMLAGNFRVSTGPFQAASSTGRHRGGILRRMGGYGGFRVSPRLGRSALSSRAVTSPVASTASARAQGSSVSISSLRVNPSRTYRRNIPMGFRLQ
jgi:hypothetical protein